MESLTWEEFKNSIKRIDCESCEIHEPKECEVKCIQCYGDFREWHRKARDLMAIDDIRKKITQ